jgi:hypothetical protein
MTAKQALREIVETLTEEEAEQLLDYLNMLADPDELSEEELAEVVEIERRMKQGEYVSLGELRAKYNP